MTTTEKIQEVIKDLSEDKREAVLAFAWSLGYRARRAQAREKDAAVVTDPNFDPAIDWSKDDFTDWPGYLKSHKSPGSEDAA